jgi:hypothetical protein
VNAIRPGWAFNQTSEQKHVLHPKAFAEKHFKADARSSQESFRKFQTHD